MGKKSPKPKPLKNGASATPKGKASTPIKKKPEEPKANYLGRACFLFVFLIAFVLQLPVSLFLKTKLDMSVQFTPVESLNSQFPNEMAFHTVLGKGFPLVATPLGLKSPEFLLQWINKNQQFIEENFYKYGGVLFRGFDITKPEQFEQVALSLYPDLDDFYLGTSPRKQVNNTRYVFTASEFDSYIAIPHHCEMSFLKSPPPRILFYGQRPNAPPGGETPISDFAAVWRHMKPDTKKRFSEKGIRNIRHYPSKHDSSLLNKFDPLKTKFWEDMFQTDDKSVAENIAQKEGFEIQWVGSDKSMVRLVNSQGPTRVHPVTGVETWHNHAQVFHITSIPNEYFYQAVRLNSWKYAAYHFIFRTVAGLMRIFIGDDNVGQHATHADGSPILQEDIDHVRELMWQYGVAYPHQAGDVVMIDNMRLAHGRQAYGGPRRVLVSWAKGDQTSFF